MEIDMVVTRQGARREGQSVNTHNDQNEKQNVSERLTNGTISTNEIDVCEENYNDSHESHANLSHLNRGDSINHSLEQRGAQNKDVDKFMNNIEEKVGKLESSLVNVTQELKNVIKNITENKHAPSHKEKSKDRNRIRYNQTVIQIQSQNVILIMFYHYHQARLVGKIKIALNYHH